MYDSRILFRQFNNLPGVRWQWILYISKQNDYSSEFIRFVLDRCDVNDVDSRGRTILSFIYYLSKIQVKVLLEEYKPKIVVNGKIQWPFPPSSSQLWGVSRYAMLFDYDTEGVYLRYPYRSMKSLYKSTIYDRITNPYFNHSQRFLDVTVNEQKKVHMLIQLFDNHKKKKFTFFEWMVPILYGSFDVGKIHEYYFKNRFKELRRAKRKLLKYY